MTSRASLQAALAHRLGSSSEARWMVEEVLGPNQGRGAGASAGPGLDADADEASERALRDMAARRLGGEPLQYVLGTWPFRSVDLAVDARALIPRPETEQVVDVALAEVRRQDAAANAGTSAGTSPAEAEVDAALLVADIGTGTGAIALSVAVELGASRPALRVVATDVDPGALALAAENLRRVSRRHPHVPAQVELCRGSWFDALASAPERRGRFHLVVANPPYVSEHEWGTLEPGVRREPYGALVAGPGTDGTPGFGALEAVLTGAREWLAPGGAVVAEMAPHHAAPAFELAVRAGYRDVRVEPDFAGRERAVVARR